MSSQGRRGLRGVSGWRAQALDARERARAGELEKRTRVLIALATEFESAVVGTPFIFSPPVR